MLLYSLIGHSPCLGGKERIEGILSVGDLLDQIIHVSVLDDGIDGAICDFFL